MYVVTRPAPLSYQHMDTARAILLLVNGEQTVPRSAVMEWAWDQKVPKRTTQNLLSLARGLGGFEQKEKEVLGLLCARQKELPRALEIIATKLRHEILVSKEMDSCISTTVRTVL